MDNAGAQDSWGVWLTEVPARWGGALCSLWVQGLQWRNHSWCGPSIGALGNSCEVQFSCFVVPQALDPSLWICHFTAGYSGCRQSWELAFPLRPHDRVPEFVCDSGATLKEKSDGKLLAGNRVNIREITRCFPQLPLVRTPGGRKCLRVFPLAYGSFKGLVPNAVLIPWPVIIVAFLSLCAHL